MSQPSVAAYFTTRKRAASEEIRNKAKVLCLDQETTTTRNSSISQDKFVDLQKESSTLLTIVPEDISNENSTSPKQFSKGKSTDVDSPAVKSNSAVRNIIFDLQKPGTPKTPRMNTRARTRSRKLSCEEGQTDIRETFMKFDGTSTNKNVIFEKKGLLSPKKRPSSSRSLRTPKKNEQEAPAAGSVTPKKTPRIDAPIRTDLNFAEIKNKINQSSRLAEIKERINKIRNCDEKLTQLQAQNDKKQEQKPHIQKFDQIQLEIPVR